MIKKYYGKHVTKKLLLRKCYIRFIVHFTLAAEGYMWGKVIFLALGMIFFFYFHFGFVASNFYLIPEKSGFFFGKIILFQEKTGE